MASSLAYDTSGRHLIRTTTAEAPSGCDPATDPGRCRLSSSALAVTNLSTMSGSQTTTYTYADPNWPSQPTRIGRDSVEVRGQTSTESFTFDPATGEALVHTVSGAVDTSGTQESHTTTTALYGGGEVAAFSPGGAFQSAWLTLPQPSGLKKSIDGPRTDVADVTTLVYYPFDPSVPGAWRGRLAAIRNAAGQTARFEDYDVFGHAATSTDANGVVTRMTFDGLGRVLTSTTAAVPGCNTTVDPLCATDLTTTRTYASVTGPLSSEQRPAGNVASYTRDSRGRMATLTRGTATAGLERTTYTYDPTTGKKSSEVLSAYQNGTWTTTKSETFSYTSDGNLSRVVHADNTSVVYAYLPDGTLSSVQDENHTTPNMLYAYDPANRLSSVTQTLASAPGGQTVTAYSYDVAGNLASVTDPNGNVTTYSYDDFNRMQKQVSPVSGTTTWGCDFAGNPVTTTDANGATTTRTWDMLNRALSSSSTRSGNSETVTWTYDDAASGNFGLGRVASMTDPSGSTAYQYERRGLLRLESKSIHGAAYNTSYAYDVDGNRSSITDPSGLVERYGFDFADRPYSLTAGPATIVSAAAWLPFGPLTSITFGNGTTRTMQYDNRYRPLENKVTGPAGTLADYTYAEDNAGNITQIHDATNAAYNRDFGYDDLNRLTTANGGTQLWGAGSYTYDAMGNMLSSSLGSWKSTASSLAGTTPKLSAVVENGVSRAVTYDAAGNELNAGTSAYGYSPRNQLVSAEVAGYVYDGRGVMTIGSAALLGANIAPSSVTGGSTTAGAITLSVASTTDTVVALSSNNASAFVPATVTVAAGATTASFTVATNPVAANTPVTVSATYQQSTATAALTILAPQLASVAVAPATVGGGSTSTGTATLTGTAAVDMTVALASNNAVATVPSSITVAAGTAAASFTVTTTSVGADTAVTLTATLTQTVQTAQLRVVQPQLASISISPTSIISGKSGTVTVSLNAAAVTSTVAGLGGVNADLSSYSVTIPPGSTSATFSFVASRLQNNVSAAGSVSATFDNVTVQASFTDVPPPLLSLSVSPPTVVGGTSVTAQATLDGYAPWSGISMPLTATSSNAWSPAGISFAWAGSVPPSSSASGEVLTAPVPSQTSVVVSGTQAGVTQSAAIVLQPAAITIGSFTVSPTSVIGSNPVTGTITLTAAAPAGGIDVDLAPQAFQFPSVDMPAFIHVPAAMTSATFTIPTHEVATTQTVTLSAIHSAAEIDVPVTLTAISNPYTLCCTANIGGECDGLSGGSYETYGGSFTGAVTFNNKVTSRTAVTLTSSNRAVISVPSSVTVAKGATQASFTMSAASVTSPTTVTVTATYGGVNVQDHILILPPNDVIVSQPVQLGGLAGGYHWPETLYLNGYAPAGGAVVAVGSTRAGLLDVPVTITVAAGAQSVGFSIYSHQFLGHAESLDVTFTYGGITRTARATVLPVTPAGRLDSGATEAVRCASLSLAPCLTGIGLRATTTLASSDPARYDLYTPELQLMAETVQSTSSSKPIAYSYLWFGGQPVAEIDATTNTTRWHAVDHLGTPFLQTDAAGAVVWRAEYTPYGDVFAYRAGSTLHQPLRLPGQTTTDGNALYNNIFRWYRSGWGRYTQADPIGLRGGINIYAYGGARPTRFIDPYGLVRVSCCGEDLQKAIDNARRRMLLLEKTGSEDDPNGSNEIVAATLCETFTMYDALGQRRQVGVPTTKRNDRFEDGKCAFLCTSVHEAYHREQCREFAAKGLTTVLTNAQWEWPAYREESRCLESAQKNKYLNIRSSPPGFVEY